jgi:hypothetical protein
MSPDELLAYMETTYAKEIAATTAEGEKKHPVLEGSDAAWTLQRLGGTDVIDIVRTRQDAEQHQKPAQAA